MRLMYGEESERLLAEQGEIKWSPAPDSQIAEFYKQKNVFITGASGFLGKLLVEKLLRACPDIDTIYILLRPKKGEDELTRLDKIYSDPIFSVLAKLQPKFQHKISIIKGDVSLPDLGVSECDRRTILEKVNVIYHVAATVRFDEKMPLAVAINIRGTRDLLTIAKQCQNLETFVHVSTAYTNCNRVEIGEKIYKPHVTGDDLINMMETLPESVLIKKAPELVRDWPNNYTFTKAIAEETVQKHSKGVPCCIFRPAIVIATYKEPLRSWINNMYGATGVVAGAGLGLLKSINCCEEKAAEIVPADYVINGMIAASYKTAIEKKVDEIPIYNYVSSVEKRHTWKEFMKLSSQWGEEVPSIRAIWYYSLTLNRYWFVHFLYVMALHFLPGLIMDLGLIISGKKPMMLKVYKKINKFESVIAHFATNEWAFSNDNVQNLWRSLSDADKHNFPFSMADLDWQEYHKTHILGLRKYLIREDMATMSEARKKWRRLYILHKAVKFLFYFFLVRIALALISAVLRLAA